LRVPQTLLAAESPVFVAVSFAAQFAVLAAVPVALLLVALVALSLAVPVSSA